MILLTGGYGLLGKELTRLLNLNPLQSVPKRHSLDILREPTVKRYQDIFKENYSLIIHCAAYTDVAGAEDNKQLAYDTNVIGTRNLAALGIPMVYISTEYVFDGEKGDYTEEDYPSPQNFYSFTKLLGEYESRRTHSVVIRCLFKPRPFEWPAACIDQFTTGDYVDRIAPEIALAIKKFDKLPPILHIGTEKKTTYELAKRSRPDVCTVRVEDIRAVKLPRDTSLDTRLWERIKNE